ncbi:Uma2 family endonuclease [Geminicoccus flavidas]|uniref:Uma2 family endonuclease n=1 Tax=Geminicoccus flavidas TaxID=2506407 RepID=UPI0013584EF9|nr:Uma2 family endonuclease [Geminicoccus flavidas]
MALAQGHAPMMTVTQFQARPNGADARHELVDGVVRIMVPPPDEHGEVRANLVLAIHPRLKPPCRLVTGAGVPIDQRNYFQADLVIRSGSREPQGQPTPPAVVIEVLSPATMPFDFSCKLLRYTELPSVQEIWMVDSSRAWVQVWQRQGAHWSVAMASGSARFGSAFLGAEIALDQVYAGITFAPVTEDDADAVGL